MTEPTPPPLFRFRDVSVTVDGVTILDGVTAEVADRGITVVTGPSGSGKSTLLRLCNRLEVPTDGIVEFRGTDVSLLDPRELRRRVGMVFQRPTVFPGTAADNLTVVDPDADVETLLEAVGLPSELADRPADVLSGGEQQRLCVARALTTRPEALLMDEPTSALDLDATLQLESLARRLADDGIPMLWVTHDEAQAERIGDAFLRLEGGKLVEVDP